jgi:hypothetical protein
VTWPWLTGTAALLFMFIMTVLNVPQTLASNWQLVQSAARWVRRGRPFRRVRRVRKAKRGEPLSGGASVTGRVDWTEFQRAYGRMDVLDDLLERASAA